MNHSTLTFVFTLSFLCFVIVTLLVKLLDLRNTFMFLSQNEIKQYIPYH